jgi:hypothetical protein
MGTSQNPMKGRCKRCGMAGKRLLKFKTYRGSFQDSSQVRSILSDHSPRINSVTAPLKSQVRSRRKDICPLCGVPSILKNNAILLEPDQKVPPCPACGIGATPALIQLFRHRAFVSRIKKMVYRATITGRPFRKIELPGVVILPNGSYFSTRVGMGRRQSR